MAKNTFTTCDRCGASALYDGVREYQIHFHNPKYNADHAIADLCAHCFNNFIDWWGSQNPTNKQMLTKQIV